MKKVQVVFGFDMETDIGSWTPYYEGFVKGTPKILNVLKKNDITATFYFTGHSASSVPTSSTPSRHHAIPRPSTPPP